MSTETAIDWVKEEENYLQTIEATCIRLSKDYHQVYFEKKRTQTQLRIPAIIVGSFTGVASFGTTTFPQELHKWVAIVVGVINIGIAILSTLETFFKVGEDMTAARTTSDQLRKLAEDIHKELALPVKDRPTSGIIFLKEMYTRYQQIISSSPMLPRFIFHAEVKKPQKVGWANRLKQTVSKTKTSPPLEQDEVDVQDDFDNGFKGISSYLSASSPVQKTKVKPKAKPKAKAKTKVDEASTSIEKIEEDIEMGNITEFP